MRSQITHLSYLHEHLKLDGLHEVPQGALLHGFDRRLDGRVARDEDHWNVEIACSDAFEELNTIHAWHVDVAEDHVERGGLDGACRRRAIWRGLHPVSLAGQRPSVDGQQRVVIVNHENVRPVVFRLPVIPPVRCFCLRLRPGPRARAS
jgi:hypothetical protein